MKKIILFAVGVLTSVAMLAGEKKDTVINHLKFRYDTKTHTAALVGTDADITEIKFTNPIMKIEGVEYSVKTISYDAFINNTELVRVIIPEGVDSIGNNAFAGCSTIRFIEFPSTIRYFGQDAFGGCSSMDFVSVNSSNADLNLRNYLPNNQSMTLYVPEGRSGGYKDVNLENSWKTKFGDRIYEGKMEIKSFEINGLEMKFVCATNKNSSKNKATLYTYDTDISFVEIPSKIYTYTIVGIGRPAFANKGLQRLKIDGELDYIHPNAFSGCRNLVYIGWNESDLQNYSPNIFPKNELMTLFVPADSKYYYDQKGWNNEQFGDRIYGGVMTDMEHDGMKYIYAKGSYGNEAVLIEGKDGKSLSVGYLYLGSPNADYDYTKQYYVKTIGRSAFAGKNVESITISSDVTAISNQAFQGCSNLKTLSLPSCLVTIGSGAFSNCSSLTELSLPASVQKIGSGAFAGCNNLVRVESKSSTPIIIPDNLFVINNNIEKILYCPNVSSYQSIKGWKDGFTYFLQGDKIADKTFEYKDKDENKVCDITYAWTTSSSNAIIMSVSNSVLQNFEVPATIDGKNVIGIYRDAFKQANAIEQLSFEDKEGAVGLIIGKGAVNNCSKLRFLKLPSRLDKLGSGAFGNCNSLAHILFKSDASLLGSEPFSGNTKTNATIYIPSNGESQVFVERGWNINNIVKADSLEEFADIKKGMTYIGWKQAGSEKGTAKLTIGISGSSEEQFDIDSLATSKRGTIYKVIGIANNAFSNTGSFKTLKIAEGIASIGASAFRNRPLTRIILPESLKSIGENAFNGCRNLIDIEAHEGKQLKFEEIGASVFQNCTSLEKVTLPSTLKSIGLNAFAGCTKLLEIESKIQNPYDIDVTVFPNYSATLYVPYDSYDAYTKKNGWKNFGDHISKGERVEYNEKGLNYVYASHGKTATLIKSNPEEKIPEIRTIIPGTDVVVTTIAESAFKDNRNLESIIIPDSIKIIGAKAFENCSNVKKIVLSKSLSYIGDNAFGGLVNLKTIISKVPADRLENLCSSIINVFISDTYQSITSSPEIFIPVGENSESVYKEKWSAFHDSKFVVGYPDYDKEAADRSGWFFDILTTVDENEIEGDDTQEVVFGTATLKRAKERGESDGNLIVPLKVKFDKKVYVITKIADNAFNEYPTKSDVKNLIIPDSVTEIGANAFRGFSSVQKVWLPKSLTNIGARAFDGCNAITHVCSKMENPKSMSDDLFSIPEVNTATLFVPSMSGYEAGSWSKFSNVVVGEYVNDYVDDKGMVFACSQKTVGEGEGAAIVRSAILTRQPSTNNREALIPSSVKCAAPESTVENAYDVVSIGKYAFRNCALLDKIELPSTITSIGYKAFENSSKIKTIISAIPSNKLDDLCDINSVLASDITPDFIYVPVGSIEDYQAKWNRFDSKLFLAGTPGYDTESAGNSGWFYDYLTTEADDSTKPLKGIATLKRTTKKIDEKGELLIPSEVVIKEKTYKVTKIADNAFNEYPTKSDVKNLVIPDSVTEIGANAFRGFSSVQKVWLPKSLTDIGSKAFDGCNAITHVCSKMENPKSMSDDLFSIPDVNTATLFVPSMSGYEAGIWSKFSNVVVGEYVNDYVDDKGMVFACSQKTVGEGEGATIVRSAILTKQPSTNNREALIPSSVKCAAPESTVENAYDVVSIGKYAFRNCALLDKIELPSTITSIGDKAFENSSKIKTIISAIPSNKLDDLCDINNVLASDITPDFIYVPLGSIEDYQAKWNRFDPKLFLAGAPGYDTESAGNSGWFYDYLTTEADDSTKPLKGIATLKRTTKKIDEKGELLIPSEVVIEEKTYKVTKIADNAFNEYPTKLDVKNLIIPDSVTEIGANAFRGFSSVQKVWLPKSLTYIGSKAFDGCNAITHVCSKMDNPKSMSDDLFSIPTINTATLFVPSMSGYTTDSWTKFSNVVVGEYVKDVTDGDMTFACYQVKKSGEETAYDKYAILTKASTNIRTAAVKDSISSDELKFAVLSIGKYAFYDCKQLAKVELPKTLTSIGENAFAGCTAIKEIVSDIENVFPISSNVFSADILPTAMLYIPDKTENDYKDETKSGGWAAFDHKEEGKWVELKDPVEKYFKFCFHTAREIATLVSVNSTNLEKSLIIPKSISVTHEGKTYNPKVTEIGKSAFQTNTERANIERIDIQADIESIGDNAFQGCTNLTTINFPDSLKSIGNYAFNGTNLSKLISTSVKSIGTGAFSNTKITEVRLDSVKSIGANAFQYCSSLRSVWLPKTLSLESIGSKAFDGCNNITNVSLKIGNPGAIGDDVFSLSNTQIATLFVPAGEYDNYDIGVWKNKFANIVEGEFLREYVDPAQKYTYSLYDLPVAQSDTIKAAILTKSPTGLTSVSVPDSISVLADGDAHPILYAVKEIGQSAFKDRTGITKVELPKTLTSIGDNAFAGCTDIKEIVSDIENVFKISSNVFSDDIKKTAKVYIPDESMEKYKKADGWAAFENKEEGKWLVTEEPVDVFMKYRYHTALKTAILVGVNPTVGETKVTIPEKVTIGGKEYTVSEIGESVFKTNTDKNNIEKIEVQALIKSIGANAFQGSAKLSEVILPSVLETIGSYAFQGCPNLTTINFPDSLKSVGEFAFNGTKLSKLHSAAIKSIGVGAFSNSPISELRLDTVEFIGANAFQYCSSLKSVWLPKTLSLESIGSKAFDGCNNITNVSLKIGNPGAIGDDVFSLSNTQIATLFVPAGEYDNYNIGAWKNKFANIVEGEFLREYEDPAQKYVYSLYELPVAQSDTIKAAILTKSPTGLTRVSVPDSISVLADGDALPILYAVKEIGQSAFKDRTGITKVELPKTLTSIGDNAFAGCAGIKEIVSDIEDVFPISSNVFSADILPTAMLYIPDKTENDYKDETKSGGWAAFDKKEEGKWVELKDPVEKYFKFRFHTAREIATLVSVNSTNLEKSLIIPKSISVTHEGKTYNPKVTEIGKSAFQTNTDRTNIERIDIQADIESIGDNAFQGCTNLTTINFPDSLKTIGSAAFQNCSNLQKIWLPASLTKIGNKAFAGCYNLIRICTESFATIENADAFSTYGKAILFVPTGALATINEKAGWRDFTRKYEGYYEGESPESVERSYIYLKQKDESRNAILTKSTTSDPIKTAVAYDNKDYIVNIIGENAFSGVKLEEWTSLPEGIVAVDKNAFKNCSLQELTLPSSLKTIGDGAFSGNGLKKIELPSTLTRIAENAFDGCNNLTEVFSRITDKKVIADNSLSVPHAILYVNEGYADKYAGWNFLHILDGEKMLGSYAGVDYIYTVASKKAILVSVPKDAIKDGAVIIPPAIPLGKDHVVCDVISIDKDAFSDIKSDVKTVTIGENVKTIGTGLFQSCSNLTDIICNNVDNDFIINNVISLPQATLYVPEHADWYKNAGWTFAHYYEGERKEKAQDGLVYAYTEGSNEAILVKVSENTDWPNGKVTIPSSIKIEDVDYHVISIANSVFNDNIKIKTVEIGANIQSIGANAFQNCRNLKEVVSKITDPVVIGSIAFSKSDAILYIPNDGLLEAYSSSWKFAQIYAGERYEVENEGLAYVCVKTSTDKTATLVGLGTQGAGIKNGILDIPVSIPVTNEGNFDVVAIADNAFSGVNDIEYINVRSKALLESSALNKDIFSRYVATLYVPHGALESYVLCDVWKTFPVKKEGYLKGVKSQDGLKYECLINGENKYVASLIKSENLVKVDIPTSVKLDGVDDAYAVTSIYKEAFKGCNGLKVVWLPATLESIDKTAFAGCNGIAYVSSAIDNPTAADANIFPSSATLFVPQGRKSNYNIGGWNNFAYVGEGRFVDVATASDMSFDCYTDNAGTKKAILKKYNVNAATVEIPGSVKVGNDAYTVSIITKQAFASRNNMENLVIPSGVETIEAETFSACSKLKWIESKIVNPISISNVFANTNATLFIPSNNVVSDYKARGWNFLNVFVGERKQTDVDGWTYVYSTGDKKAVLTRVGNVGTNVTINGTFKIGREEYTVTSVGDAVFKGKSNIEALTIAKSIENIGANAFEGCVNLESITCEGSSPAKLGTDAFPTAKVTVNVPKDAVDTYKQHADWRQFETILGITTSVEDDPTGPYNIIVPAGGDATPEVEIWNGLDASGDVVIPEVVELNGSDYKVTGIAANAYDSNTDLTSVVIPSSITSIGASAFAGCTNLKSITVYCVTPINLSAVATTRRALTRAGGSSSVFEGVNKETCILYVPAESIDAYKQAEGWKDFKKIYAISATAINGIVISEGKPFDVYNLQGRKVKAHTTTFSGLPAGVYIVNGKKVMVK